MAVNRRDFLIKGIGSVICAGAVPTFLPGLLPETWGTVTGRMAGNPGNMQEVARRHAYKVLTIGTLYGMTSHSLKEAIEAANAGRPIGII